MFTQYFDAAAAHVRGIGLEPAIMDGTPVGDAQLNETEEAIGRPIPQELRAFFTEMGDGFSFCPMEGHEGFQLGRLGDYRYKVAGFVDVLREEAPPGGNKAHSADVLADELTRRERWFPFYGFGGGGYLFCLDMALSPAAVRYHERLYWPTDPIEHWQLSMADSLEDFIHQWSRYCFSNANGAGLLNVALNARGRFDWAPTRFERRLDRLGAP